ncbi:pyridoxal kinase PdxY [Pseudomonas fulva]|nr:pyridoxal kinase PdxY [Pseudomonas fulva]MBF8778615.1 pyridoxal kinase PdxY [Pseudomonas fulva]
MKRTPRLLCIQPSAVSGHAGNSAAVLPMQRLGVNVWPLDTAQLPHCAGHDQWAGEVLSSVEVSALLQTLEALGELGDCDALLSGRLASAEQGRVVLAGVQRLKSVNPKALYLCDPGIGRVLAGGAVTSELKDFLHEQAVTHADILCLDPFELEDFSGRPAGTLADCLSMARSLLARGPKAVLIKRLCYAEQAADAIEMLLVSQAASWHLQRPLLAFPRQPAGVGELTAGLFLARVLLGDDWPQALEFTAAAVHEVLLETQACASCELQLVRAQDRIAHPRVRYEARRLDD